MDSFLFIKGIEDIFTRYWGGHFEVVTTFFSRPRPREQLIAWLDLQLYKEIHVVPGKAQALIDMYEKLDSEVERGEYEAEAYELADEVQHYRLLADIRQLVTGVKLKATDAKPTQEQLKLEEVRRKYAKSKSALVRGVSGFSPGGGVAFAAAGSMIEGGPIERQLAEAFKIIYRQEHVHYSQRRPAFDRLARESDRADYREALEFARELARQHFILRNESFAYPLDAGRVKEIDAGKVVPYVPPRLY
ncbi:MAG TPA: hypothetical protein VGL11_14155 [Candidatus Binatia bacterium]|jgi:hypothetical protein